MYSRLTFSAVVVAFAVLLLGGIDGYAGAAISVACPGGQPCIVTDDITDGAVTPAKLSLYGNVAIVATTGGDFTDPLTAMNNISSVCGTPSASNPCLVKIMPGVYNIGANSLQMKDYVDIEGSGENVTAIIGTVDGASTGVIKGASNATIRLLSVQNVGGGSNSVGFYNVNASPKMRQITVSASGGSNKNYGIFNSTGSQPIMTNVTSSASGGNWSYGVYNYNGSSPLMDDVRASASGGTTNTGIHNQAASPVLVNIMASATGGTTSIGIGGWNSAAKISNSQASASNASSANFGISNDSSRTAVAPPIFTDVIASASGGVNANGIASNISPIRLVNVTANASGASNSNNALILSNSNDDNNPPFLVNVTGLASGTAVNYGFYNFQSKAKLTNSRLIASGGSKNVGIYSYSHSVIKVDNSAVIGTGGAINRSFQIFNDTNAFIGNSQLEGALLNAGGPILPVFKCIGVYDSSYNALACP